MTVHPCKFFFRTAGPPWVEMSVKSILGGRELKRSLLKAMKVLEGNPSMSCPTSVLKLNFLMGPNNVN